MGKAAVKYGELYNALYRAGYHAKEKNHGRRFIKPLLKHYNFETILDCGCSNGVTTKLFQGNGKKAFGIDVSNIAIRYAQEKYGTINCNEASVLDIPFKDNFFDAVFSCDMLEHLIESDIDQAISEIQRVGKKYLFMKISDTREGNNEFTEKIHAQGLFTDIKNLHLTVKPLSWWINKFTRGGEWKQGAPILDMLVFYATN